MSDDERGRRLEKAYATLAGMPHQLPSTGRKFASTEEANAWLVEVVGKRTYTQAEIEKRLDDFIKYGPGGNTEQS